MWLTYRSNFPAIGETNLVTDMGWGCMLRTGQMLLAQALITHYLGRGTLPPLRVRARCSTER
jgi:cysteine protease ATG4